ncbi:hypothetical protein LEP1GSC034_4349 [Leptospira interrogans str. 2003000735]|uniref:Uncharacterized protein n=4 Tax=Leptospira interrogans TaxID=173 RepID=M6ZP68_LEPIR|nr:hypothetical protein LEP1GSC077_3964 [Leptospira interrogans str. C10069]EKP24233.1 hypothetical protein LEP1GSC117_1621 [Leptospira interrogans serovar Icterohaemorrhagiae str. Verdun LP]EKP75322.1 hypothetical protein LEP1GSC173_2997 [Leptospira interrogans str. HAI1594]EKQ37324.1 hypothetical protein LEP1GSC025_0083 [Leptospira interrogans str. 2002000621]EKR18982.1 hypothetical protein LEP1GSC019_0601 [Leptospira interrogans serovar Pyrogenes str. 2006006960]EKR46127.1 hypothetical prot
MGRTTIKLKFIRKICGNYCKTMILQTIPGYNLLRTSIFL